MVHPAARRGKARGLAKEFSEMPEVGGVYRACHGGLEFWRFNDCVDNCVFVSAEADSRGAVRCGACMVVKPIRRREYVAYRYLVAD